MGWNDLCCASLWILAFFPNPRKVYFEIGNLKGFPLLPCCQQCSLAHHLAYPACCYLHYKIMKVVMQHKIILGEFWSHLHLYESEVGFWLWFLLLVLQKGGWFGAPLSFEEKSLGVCVRVGEEGLKKWKRIIWTGYFSSPQRLLLGISSFKCDLLHSWFHVLAQVSNKWHQMRWVTERKVLVSLFSLNSFRNHFYFLRVLIKEFFPYSFFPSMFIQIKLDTLEKQRTWLENTCPRI